MSTLARHFAVKCEHFNKRVPLFTIVMGPGLEEGVVVLVVEE